jgi:serine/threonine protein phosphatase PrpC
MIVIGSDGVFEFL